MADTGPTLNTPTPLTLMQPTHPTATKKPEAPRPPGPSRAGSASDSKSPPSFPTYQGCLSDKLALSFAT